ncbi:MAG: M20/M25/M40 family metallo-hydrolase [Candidatus Hydrogenedentes bacterium]|nr:M20/M25/M40 family metallo-hydrolase [Candidatus Hydrogenedentota bacterium]
MNNQNRSVFWCALAALLFTFGMTFYAMYSLKPPRALPKDTPSAEFSAYRAVEHAFACSSKTHPAGSRNNDETAQYLLSTLKEMGLEAEFMSTADLKDNNLQLQQAVIGRIPGTDSTGSVTFSAHYDSVPYGPGATDDIGGCITMLETARAFMSLPRMRNDLVFAFLDAEEIGGYGARGFCDHPLAEDIGIVTNLDVRGTKGPALVYETSSNNGALIDELCKAKGDGVLPVASSLMFAIYERSPFGSDFTKFRNAGKKGYNIAYIDNFMWYHTVNDSPEHVHPPSIQHMGAYSMGIARHFGNVDFEAFQLESPNATYFNTLGYGMVRYPLSRGTPLAMLAVVLLMFVIAAGLFTGRITFKGFALSLVLTAGGIMAAALTAFAMLATVFGYENALYLYTVKFTYIPGPEAFYYSKLYCYAFGAMGIAIGGLFFSLVARRLRVSDLYAAGLVWMLPILAVMVFMFPGGSFLATWPILFGALGLALVCLGTREEGISPGWLLAATLFAIPALCLLPPAWKMMQWMLMILVAPALAGLAVILLLNIMPALVLLGRTRRLWAIYPVFAAVALLLVTAGLALSKPSKDCPKMDSVVYYADLTSGAAWWLSEDEQVDEWTRQFFPTEARASIEDLLPGKPGDHYLRAEAPLSTQFGGLNPGSMSSSLEVNGKRQVTMRLKTADYPYDIHLRQVEGPPISAVKIDGREVKEQDGAFSFSFQLFPGEGYELSFETASDAPIVFEALSSIYGFPEIPGITPRPEYIVPEPNTMRSGIHLRSEHIYVKNRFEIAPEITPAATAVVPAEGQGI